MIVFSFYFLISVSTFFGTTPVCLAYDAFCSLTASIARTNEVSTAFVAFAIPVAGEFMQPSIFA